MHFGQEWRNKDTYEDEEVHEKEHQGIQTRSMTKRYKKKEKNK